MKIIFFVLVAFSAFVSPKLIILSPPGLAGEGVAYTYHYAQPGDFSITGNLTVPNPETGCSVPSNAAEITGRIAIAFRGGACSYETKIRNLQKAIPIGILLADAQGLEPVFVSALIKDWGSTSDLIVPTLFIDKNVASRLKEAAEKSEVVTIEMISETTPWIEFTNGAGWRVPQAIAIFLLFAGFFWALYKLALFIRARGFQPFSVPQLALVTLSISFILRVIALIDPVYSCRCSSYSFVQIATTFWVAWAWGATLLLTFYWLQITSSKIQVSTAINRLKWPFIISVAIIFVVDLVTSITIATQFDDGLGLVVKGILLILIQLAISLFYLVAGLRLLIQLSKGRSKSRKITMKIIMTTIGRVGVVIGYVLFISPVYQSEAGVTVANTFILYGSIFVDLVNVWIFKLKEKEQVASSNSENKVPLSSENSPKSQEDNKPEDNNNEDES